MTEQRPDVPTDHEPALIAEPFLRYYEGHLRSEEAREAFTRGGELGYRRYIFEHLY